MEVKISIMKGENASSILESEQEGGRLLSPQFIHNIW